MSVARRVAERQAQGFRRVGRLQAVVAVLLAGALVVLLMAVLVQVYAPQDSGPHPRARRLRPAPTTTTTVPQEPPGGSRTPAPATVPGDERDPGSAPEKRSRSQGGPDSPATPDDPAPPATPDDPPAVGDHVLVDLDLGVVEACVRVPLDPCEEGNG